jgi:hypothetical protein
LGSNEFVEDLLSEVKEREKNTLRVSVRVPGLGWAASFEFIPTVDFNGGLNPGPLTQTSFPFIPNEVKSISWGKGSPPSSFSNRIANGIACKNQKAMIFLIILLEGDCK